MSDKIEINNLGQISLPKAITDALKEFDKIAEPFLEGLTVIETYHVIHHIKGFILFGAELSAQIIVMERMKKEEAKDTDIEVIGDVTIKGGGRRYGLPADASQRRM